MSVFDEANTYWWRGCRKCWACMNARGLRTTARHREARQSVRRECPSCAIQFTPRRSDQRYCTPWCKNQAAIALRRARLSLPEVVTRNAPRGLP